jgi:hypothetical protein
MVDALKEIWRILVPGGFLLDWRDVPVEWPLEIISGGQSRLAGYADTSSRIQKHRSADESLDLVKEEGLFGIEHQSSFSCAWYWDTLDEAKDNLKKTVPEEVWKKAKLLMAQNEEADQIRLRRVMRISVYRKRMVEGEPGR